jgi:phage terminase large subunit-like protein
MATASAMFESGKVYFPEQAKWLADLEAELFAFPVSRHDDQVDSISQALLSKNFPMIISDATLARARAETENMLARQRGMW